MEEDRFCNFCEEIIPRPKVVIQSTTYKKVKICEDCVKRLRKENVMNSGELP